MEQNRQTTYKKFTVFVDQIGFMEKHGFDPSKTVQKLLDQWIRGMRKMLEAEGG